MVDKIDPGLLADVVIKSTALQEKTNAALRAKGSPYRIAEVTITATLPPQIGFSIARIGDVEEALTGAEVDSSQLVQAVIAEEAAAAETNGSVPAYETGDEVVTDTEAVVEDDQAILP
jgi:hypothetical protein